MGTGTGTFFKSEGVHKMRVTKLYTIAISIGLLAASCACLYGQTTSSQLIGVVEDPANAVISGADVQITDQDSAASRTMKSRADGSFIFADIAAGRYTLTIKASGFKTRVQKNIEVQTSDNRNVGNISMELGNVSDQITVTAEAAAIQLSSSEKSREVDNTEIENMPERGRDIFGYIGTLPGVVDGSATSRQLQQFLLRGRSCR